MQKQTEYVGFKAGTQHRQKLQSLATATDNTISGVLRALVENAEVQTVPTLKPIATLLEKSRNTDKLAQAHGVSAQ